MERTLFASLLAIATVLIAGLAGAVLRSGARARRLAEERRHLEARCSTLSSALEAARRLAARERSLAVSVLASNTSHDLVGPLRCFEDLLGIMASGEPLSSDDVAIGLEEVERFKRVVEALRAVREPGPELGPVSVAAVVARAVRATAELEPLEGRVQVDVPAGLEIEAEADAASLLFVCLLRNAAAAVRQGGGVRVAASGKGGELVIEVADTGTGIAKADRERLFLPRTWLRPGGRGLGLAMAAEISRRHGWRIAHHEREGETAFRVTIAAVAGRSLALG